MNNSEIPSKVAPVTVAEYQQWLAECEGFAARAGFRDLLDMYFDQQPPEDYPELAVGAKEILDGVVRGILSEGQLKEDLSSESRLRKLIRPD